jgi:hypothetical protein
MKTFYRNIFFIATISIALISCDDQSSTNSDLDLLEIQTVVHENHTVTLSALKPLETGYNRLFWSISQNGETEIVDSVSITPLMTMTDHTHACPFEKPFSSIEAHGKHEGYVIFNMPSGMMGSWNIKSTFWLRNQIKIETDIPVSVLNSWKLQSFSANGTKYFVSWVSPEQPIVGKNTVRLFLHKKGTMMHFPSTNDFDLSLYPYMDMGGGEGHSAPFEQLQAIGNGVFEGSISYSMSGDWQISVNALEADTTLASVVFNMNVISK